VAILCSADISDHFFPSFCPRGGSVARLLTYLCIYLLEKTPRRVIQNLGLIASSVGSQISATRAERESRIVRHLYRYNIRGVSPLRKAHGEKNCGGLVSSGHGEGQGIGLPLVRSRFEYHSR